ncbi:MAG TPA: class F sortase [Acidimicrobiia bacterium]|nr:class F sortase [Acidimicrobiia bacterium]
MRRPAPAGSRVTILVVAALLAGCGAPEGEQASGPLPATAPGVPGGRSDLTVPAALVDEALDLRAWPMAVPLELQIPSLGITASVTGVGITPKNVMDAPMGPIDDPVWQQAFWYRGSAVPGALSTALLAGHVGGPRGTSAIFAHLDRLRPGDPIVVRDTRRALDVRFAVTESKTYSLDEAAEPAVLTRIYGVGPVAGTEPQPSADGLSHLTLITCTGTFRNGTHDHRLVVYATRIA